MVLDALSVPRKIIVINVQIHFSLKMDFARLVVILVGLAHQKINVILARTMDVPPVTPTLDARPVNRNMD